MTSANHTELPNRTADRRYTHTETHTHTQTYTHKVVRSHVLAHKLKHTNLQQCVKSD